MLEIHLNLFERTRRRLVIIINSPPIKKSLLLSTFIVFSISVYSQTVQVTFNVDMKNETVSSGGVHVAGNFQSVAGLGSDWNPGSTRLSDDDGDNIYSITVGVPSGTYEYKYVNGSEWGMDENPPSPCSVGNTNNREVTIGNDNLELPAFPFNGCLGAIRLSVNMKGLNISPTGVHVMGDFQQAAGATMDWNPTSFLMNDFNDDDIYEIVLMLPTGTYQYLFVNGIEASKAEILSSDCSITGVNGTNNRTFSIAENSSNPPVYCFGTCDDCGLNLNSNFDTHWWNDAVFYELFVRSFYDSDNDGIGDFRGAIEKLDYLNDGDPETETDLGITAIWLMPLMESPSYHGYDVTDYYATEPDYGSMEDFEAFLDAAHERGIKVIIDLVLNHTSNQHPWFTQSANNTNDFRDWYIWPGSNLRFQGPWGQDVWHSNAGDYYYGLFWSGMPDLNYKHQAVKDEIFKVTNFWLDKGVDGFRLDAIKYLIEDGTQLENTSGTFSLLEEFNTIVKTNNPEAFTIGEVWSNTASIIPYVQNERLDVCFEFDLASNIISAVNDVNPARIQQQMQSIQSSYPALQYGTFLTNHDMDRVSLQLGSNTDKMKLAASIYLTLPGTPFLYYGEEVNMVGAGDHENIRQPMQWSDDTNAGFSNASSWNNIGSNYRTNNVEAMEADPNSILIHYKKLIHIRNKEDALKKGNYLEVESSVSSVLSFVRIHNNEAIVVLSNLETQSANVVLNLPASSLTVGVYKVTDLYSEQDIGTVSINENGGFENWDSASTGLSSRTTRIIRLTSESSVSTTDLDRYSLNFELSPNPSVGEVKIHWEGAPIKKGKIRIISSNGSVVYEQLMHKDTLIIPTVQWLPGVYFVQLTSDGKIGVNQFVIL